MASKDLKLKNVVVSDQDAISNEEDEKELDISLQMASKDVKLKNVVVSDQDAISNEEEVEKELDISLDKLSLGPKKKLLVFSLGGLIVHRAHRRSQKDIPKKRRPDFSYGNFLIYKRPFCEEFLKFCFERFEVGLWSSAVEHNIGGVLRMVMGELESKLLFTWDQKQCTDTGFMCLENKNKPLFLKELKYLWKKKCSSLPWRDGEYSSSNTILIDTDPYKALLNPPDTAIFPEPYDPKNEKDGFLGLDGEFRVFLDGLVEAKDVPSYVKDNPFGKPAIAPSHSDWDYYSKIVGHFGKKEATELDN